MDTNLTDLTTDDVQIEIGKLKAKGLNPKTIRNAHGLINAVISTYRPNLRLDTKLPQKIPYEANIFTETEMMKVWQVAKGDEFELPILFASWLGLRMSEVRGLKYSDIQNGRVHIQRARIRTTAGSFDKPPKSMSGDRWIAVSSVIQKLVDERPRKSDDDYICPWTDECIHRHFRKICQAANVTPCRFHDLRHFAASEAHSLGVPDKYSMKRMGHRTDSMLKTVYEHTMRDKEDRFAKIIDEKMDELYNAL